MTPEGYSNIAHSTYDEWKNNTIGRAFDLDGYYGAQCWDYASLFWRNVGFPSGYPLTGNGYAYGCWTLKKVENCLYNNNIYFTPVTDKTAIRKGDIIVMDATVSNPAGHITFADEDYNGSNSIYCVGQNQGGTPISAGGTPVTRNLLGLGDFLGAFRYVGWNIPPTPTNTQRRFPWFIYYNRFRKRREI